MRAAEMKSSREITQADVSRLLDLMKDAAANNRGITLEAIQVQTLLGATGGVVNEARAYARRLESLQHIANILINDMADGADSFTVDISGFSDVMGFTIEVSDDERTLTVHVAREDIFEGEVVDGADDADSQLSAENENTDEGEEE